MDLSDDDKPRDLFGNDEEEAVEIRVNQKYAKEYQSRKQREELLNVRQQGGDEDDESSSSEEEEDEDGTLLSPSVDINILKVPTIYISDLCVDRMTVCSNPYTYPCLSFAITADDSCLEKE